MGEIDIKLFSNKNNKKLYRLSSHDNDIYIKLKDIRLPFNCQIYNNNMYLNAELYKKDPSYLQNINIINLFEKNITNKLKLDKEFISVIKDRKENVHIKCMFKKITKGLELTTKTKDNEHIDIDIFNLKELHDSDTKYDIVIKPEILWVTDVAYGITFYVVIIIG